MQVTDAQLAAMRAFLVHDTDEMTPLAHQLGEEGMSGYLHLAEAALSIAAGLRFGSGFTSADVVRFVASVRVSRIADGEEYDFHPAAGEVVLRYSVGQTVQNVSDVKERIRAELALLDALVETELSSEADVDDLLAEARELADEWLARERSAGR